MSLREMLGIALAQPNLRDFYRLYGNIERMIIFNLQSRYQLNPSLDDMLSNKVNCDMSYITVRQNNHVNYKRV